MRDLIYAVVESFYKKVVYDVLIGYHFEKFRDPETLEHHLQRLTTFWEMQLTGKITQPLQGPGFHLLMTHLLLKLKTGELGRWKMLFRQTLDELEADSREHGSELEVEEIKLIAEDWMTKIAFFEARFHSHPQMFHQG